MPCLHKALFVSGNTMKTSLTILALFFALSLLAQQSSSTLHFKTKYFDEKGKVFKSKIDTFLVDQQIDLNFYKKHFYEPYYYPQPFIDTNYKDTTIEIWRDPLKEKDFKKNWTYTTIYDNLSRAIKYIYSGCLICSQFPFNVKIYYDEINRPIRMEKRYGIGIEKVNDKLVKSKNRNFADDDFLFKYDIQGNLIQLKCLKNGRLDVQIDKM